MFQRFKGALNELVEEQSKTIQQQSPAGRNRSQSQRAARPGASPARRPLQRPTDTQQEKPDLSGPDPDPATFESDKIGGGDDNDRRDGSGNPSKPSADSTLPKVSVQDVEGKDKSSSNEAAGAAVQEVKEADSEPELPQEVTAKLRKLSKLESKYADLLRAYRKAHARNVAIEPFEAQLRENTPLTSIGEPGALKDYLNQLSQRGDMVMAELKNVSSEKDDMKMKLGQAEDRAREATDELREFRKQRAARGETDGAADEASGHDDITAFPASPVTEESSGRRPSVSSPRSLAGLLSPRKKKQHAPEDSEDMFSYDDEVPRLQSEVESRDAQILTLERDNTKLKQEISSARESTEHMMHDLESKQTALEILRSDHRILEDEKGGAQTKCAELMTEIEDCRHALEAAQAKAQESEEQLQRQILLVNDQKKEITLLKATQPVSQDPPIPTQSDAASTKDDAPEGQSTASAKSKKNKKKKKKNAAAEQEVTTANKDDAAPSPPRDNINSLLEQKDDTIETLNEKLRSHQEVVEEVENLREQLMNVGQEHVEAKEKLKSLETAKTELDKRVANMDTELRALRNGATEQDKSSIQGDAAFNEERRQLEAKISVLQKERNDLEAKVQALEKQVADHTSVDESRSGTQGPINASRQAEIEGLKNRVETLQTELKATDGVAQSRFKELGFLQTAAKRSRSDLEALRTEVATLRGARDEVATKAARVRELESRESRLRSELDEFKQRLSEEETESKRLNERVNTESSRRSQLEEANRKFERDLQRSRKEASEAATARDSLVQRLRDSEGEKTSARSRIHDLEGQVETLKNDIGGLRDDLSLKSAQHASAQSLMSSLRDQSSEMATQLKEAKERSESLEDELTDAHRLMNERGREGETMRRILSDIESRADSRVKEMRERMDVAIQERDRAEDEASTLGRRRGRELDDLKNKLRDAERGLRRATDANADLERSERDLRQRNANDAQRVEQSTQEAAEVRKAMSELRDALDEGERQAREVEADKAATQKSLEETQNRLERLQKSSKSMTEELRTLRASKARHTDSEAQSSRSSIDSSIPGRVTSPAGNGRDSPKPKVNGTGTVDYVYLKNVLLQFLEQKDRKHQMQLIPVLGMLLHFDKKDEQKWMSAITTH